MLQRFPSSLRGAFSRNDPEGGAGSGVLRPRLVTAGSGGPGHRPPGMTTWLRGARCTDPEAMPEMEARPPAENRHGGAPRGERPASWDAPHPAGCGWSRLTRATTEQVRLSALRPPLDRGGREHQGQTRAQKRAAGTKKPTLFDIVRRGHAASDGTIVSRASVARPGTQGDTSGSRFAILALGPGSHCARARALATLARDTRPTHAANPPHPA